MKKYISLLFLFFILSSLFVIRPVFAVIETSGDLQVTFDKPMFPDTTVWYPGLAITKSFSVKNLGVKTHTASLKAENTSQTGNFGDNLYIRVDEGTTNRYGGAKDKTIKNFWDNGETNLSDIRSGNTKSYTVTISMPETLDNEFQGKKTKFDLGIGFSGIHSQITINSGNSAMVQMISDQGFVSEVLGIATIEGELSATLSPTLTDQIQSAQTPPFNKKITLGLAGLLIGIFLILFYLRNKSLE